MKVTEMSLDDYIAQNKKSQKQKSKFAGAKKKISKIKNKPLQSKPVKKESPKSSILIVSNLPVSVQNDELLQIFSRVGTLVRCNILFDQLGKSKGKAVVAYKEHSENIKAVKELNEYKINSQSITVELKQRKLKNINEKSPNSKNNKINENKNSKNKRKSSAQKSKLKYKEDRNHQNKRRHRYK